jgi:hypothetical protein
MVQVLHPHQKFELKPFKNDLSDYIKNDRIAVPFSGINSIPNFIKVYQSVQKYCRGTHREAGDLISLLFIFGW